MVEGAGSESREPLTGTRTQARTNARTHSRTQVPHSRIMIYSVTHPDRQKERERDRQTDRQTNKQKPTPTPSPTPTLARQQGMAGCNMYKNDKGNRSHNMYQNDEGNHSRLTPTAPLAHPDGQMGGQTPCAGWRARRLDGGRDTTPVCLLKGPPRTCALSRTCAHRPRSAACLTTCLTTGSP